MARTVYIYAEGSDLHEEADRLVVELGALAERWKNLGARLVNQQHERTVDLQPEDLPDWFLGINLPLEKFGAREIEQLLPVLLGLAQSTDREFVVGIAEESGITFDLVFVGANSGERERQNLQRYVAGL